MAAAARASNGFKKKCGEFREELDTLEAQLETATSEDTALQIKHQINHYMLEEWEKITTSFEDLEDRHPEVPPEPQVDEGEVLTERQNLYTALRHKFVGSKVKAIIKLSAIREQGIPDPVEILQLTSAQLATRKKTSREETVTELKRKLQVLGDRADNFAVSE